MEIAEKMQQERCNENQSVIELDLLPHLDLNIDLQSIIEELTVPADEETSEPMPPFDSPDATEDQQMADEESIDMQTAIEEEVVAETEEEVAETEPGQVIITEEPTDNKVIEETAVAPPLEPDQASFPAEIPNTKTTETAKRPHPSAEMDEDEIKTEIRHLENLLLGDPTASGYIELAEFNILLKRYAYAERHLRNALELDKNNIDVKLQLADIAMKQHNYARTVSCSLDIIHREFDNYRAHTLLGLAFIRLNKRKKAEKALNMALRFNPACKEARSALTELKKQKRLF